MELNNIMLCYGGSHLYGTDTPNSDIDIRGVCFPPVKALLGLSGFEHYHPGKPEAMLWSKATLGFESDDVQVYGLAKFFALCLNANPNIIELLFAPKEAILKTSWVWKEVVKRRDLFLSTKAVHTFAGYAYSQLKRIQGHKRWLDEPPEKPNPSDYGCVAMPDGGVKWINSRQHNAYKSKLKDFQSYTTWRTRRNPTRAKLEQQHGYDTKHAAHLFRLLFEADELLTDGRLTLPLPPRANKRYFDVLGGQVPYEAVVAMAEGIHRHLKQLEKTSPLPKRPDHHGVDELLQQLQWDYLKLYHNP